MIPLKLEIEGLYSYKEKQVIDFSQLTAAGLFGIFGAVGSGKSSILEAILLALYGTTERLASKGEKNSMVNLQSQAISVNFEFKAGKNNSGTFKASYLAKRNSKNFDEVRPATHTFYEWQQGNWAPIDRDGEQIIGMKMTHFRQTVIIPQGKFREFIELKPKDRAVMMQELFGLDRFDLSHRTAKLLGITKEHRLRLATQLEALIDIHPESLAEARSALATLNEQKATLSSQIKTQEEALRKAESVREKAEELQNLKAKKQQLDLLAEQMREKSHTLKIFQKALTHLKPLLDQLHDLESEHEKYKVSVAECERFKENAQLSVEEKLSLYQKKAEEYKSKGDKEARIRDLHHIKSLNQLHTDQQSIHQQLEAAQNHMLGHSQTQQKLETTIEQLEQALDRLQPMSSSEMATLETAVMELRQLGRQIKDSEAKNADYLHQEAQFKEQQRGILQQQGLEAPLFDQSLSQYKDQLSNGEIGRDKLIQQKGLFIYVQALRDGEPCPLCGADHHPDPLAAHFSEESLLEQEKLLQGLHQSMDTLRKAQQQYEKLELHLRNIENLQEQSQAEYKRQQARQQEIYSQLQLGTDLDTIINKLEEAKVLANKVTEYDSQLKKAREALKNHLSQNEQQQKLTQELDQRHREYQTRISSKIQEISYPDLLEKYRGQSAEKIDTDIARVREYLEQLEVSVPRALDAYHDAKEKQTTNLANLQTYTGRLKEVKAKLSDLDESIVSALEEQGIKDLDTANRLLQRQVEMEGLEEEIQQYLRVMDLTKSKIEELSAHPDVLAFDPKGYAASLQQYQTIRQDLDQVLSSLSVAEKKVKDITEQLKKKAELTRELNKVEDRETNLKELDRLFHGRGFVKYVSNIYLKELIQTANIRFMKLSKNRLSMEVDESNTFWVQDHLNGGKRRLLKTLSGGQTFQASLCLALALAEKVKSLNRAEQSFFFLDEGFGALDRNSLRTVFETLKALRHEQRIVGIISHVEDLQQEVGVYAQVELDPEKGSQVSYSY